MPTLDNETPIERQQREREVELAHYARMTPVEIERLVIDKHNAEVRRDELFLALTHAVLIAENMRAGTWDDVMQYRELINRVRVV